MMKWTRLSLAILCVCAATTASHATVYNVQAKGWVDANGVLNADFYAFVNGTGAAPHLADNDHIYFPTRAGGYFVPQPIVIRNKTSVVLRGDNVTHADIGPQLTLGSGATLQHTDPEPPSILKVHEDFYANGATNGRVIIVFVECTGCAFKKLELDGQGAAVPIGKKGYLGRTNPTHPEAEDYQTIYGLLLSGCSSCVVEKCSFKDIGGFSHVKNNGTRVSFPGGCHLAIIATEQGEQIRPAAVEAPNGSQPYGAPGSACDGNQIINCRFEDENYLTEIGVRLKTDWKLNQQYGAYSHEVTNTVMRDTTFEGNSTSGGFDHGSIEVGGPATVQNKIRLNLFLNTRLFPLECDKGSRNNTIESNYVDGVHPAKGGDIVAGMRDGGYVVKVNLNPNQGPIVPAAFTRLSNGNTFQYNTIRNLHGIGQKTAMMMAQKSEDVTVRFNTVESAANAGGSLVSFMISGSDPHVDSARLWGNFINGLSATPAWEFYSVTDSTTVPESLVEPDMLRYEVPNNDLANVFQLDRWVPVIDIELLFQGLNTTPTPTGPVLP